MEKLTSSDIEWKEGDECALIDSKTNHLLIRYSYTNKRLLSNAPANSYIVTREDERGKTVFDAVNAIGSVHHSLLDGKPEMLTYNLSSRDGMVCTIEEFNKCVDELALYANSPTPVEPMYYHIEKIVFADMQRQKEEQTTEEVLHGLFDKSRSPWSNLAIMCEQIAKEHPVEAFADSEPRAAGGFLKDATQACVSSAKIEIDKVIQQRNNSPLDFGAVVDEPQTKPVYTQAMKDAGELPSVGMECNIVTPCSTLDNCTILFISDVHVVFTNSQGVEFCGGLFVYSFRPIDTRTPEQKQVDKIAHCIDINCGASSLFIAAEIQKELKSC